MMPYIKNNVAYGSGTRPEPQRLHISAGGCHRPLHLFQGDYHE